MQSVGIVMFALMAVAAVCQKQGLMDYMYNNVDQCKNTQGKRWLLVLDVDEAQIQCGAVQCKFLEEHCAMDDKDAISSLTMVSTANNSAAPVAAAASGFVVQPIIIKLELNAMGFPVATSLAPTQAPVTKPTSSEDTNDPSQTQFVPMPICRYEILDAPNGNPVEFAVLGQAVYHRWTCDTENIDTFCMFVYSCFVRDPTGVDSLDLIDEFGCFTDRYLMGNIEYPSDLMGIKEVDVFGIVGSSALFFQCQINITVKEPNAECIRPQCAEPSGRGDGSVKAGGARGRTGGARGRTGGARGRTGGTRGRTGGARGQTGGARGRTGGTRGRAGGARGRTGGARGRSTPAPRGRKPHRGKPHLSKRLANPAVTVDVSLRIERMGVDDRQASLPVDLRRVDPAARQLYDPDQTD